MTSDELRDRFAELEPHQQKRVLDYAHGMAFAQQALDFAAGMLDGLATAAPLRPRLPRDSAPEAGPGH